ncbi:amino acid adenylation domain-containing protein [Dactylosporangium sp. NPDC000244]|uniref:non-ribosomal peptide synthetase n=1 Tax=Dactylosporangium sp. NPDC000244 TaxID=3154365 RepID=UPI003317381A
MTPISPTQHRIWFVEQLVPGTALHNLGVSVLARDPIDPAPLERAVNAVIARHEVLRTRFDVVDGAPVQRVLAEARVAVRLLDDDAVEKFAREPFGLADAPLLRVGLVGRDRLVFVLHRIVADPPSLHVLLREVADLYGGHRPPPAMQYADLAARRRALAAESTAAERRESRVDELTGFPTVLDLPADRPRPALQSLAAAHVDWSVEAPLVLGLDRVARRVGATPAMTALASFAVVLGRWAGQSRILVAAPAPAGPPLIGPAVDTLVVPADMTGDPSFAEHLQRIRDAFTAAHAQPDVEFEDLVDGLAAQRNLSHHPLVQVMAAWRDQPDLPPKLADAAGIETGASQFDLDLDVAPVDGRLRCRLRYSTDLFDRVTAERFARHLRRLWELVAADPDVRLADLDLVEAPERAVLRGLGTGPTRPVDPRALPARLAEAARRRPDVTAVRAPDGEYTYAELIERAEAIGAQLAARGLRPGDLGGVALPRCRDLPAALLGVWIAGGAYVPLDPAYPPARLAHMTQDAGIKVLVSTRDLAERIPVPAGTEVLRLDEPMPAASGDRPAPAVDGDSVAYVIYTSGSTGRPKGVRVTHASLGNLLDDFGFETRFDADDRLLALTSLSFDIAGLELWLPLLTGATLIVGPAGVGGDPERLHRLLADEAVTVVQATPATWKLYVSALAATPPALRQIWSGGEHLPHSLAQALTALGPEIHNLYGPTETTIWSTRAVLGRRDTVTGIGRPIANTRLFVTDADGRELPLGVPGELCIGGAGLALGYLNRPELTAQRFTEVQGIPVYRTGDLVRWRSDGNLEYLGRLDDQVKIRGHRVEPGEIDAVARACPGVRDACTLAVPAPSGEDQLVTFVTPEPAGDSTDDWRNLWEGTYSPDRVAAGSPDRAAADDFDLRGWQDSYTRQPLPEADMRDWVARTVERIAATGARTFAEIGCGTGLLLLRLAPAAERYLGLDFSAGAVEQVRAAVGRRGLSDRVRLVTANATEIGTAAAGERFDCVVLNSVAQYFPSADYLTAVLTEASRIVEPGGHIFVGDLRSLRLAEAFHAGVLRADERIGPDELRALAARRALEEDELLLDPGYFTLLRQALPAITGIQVTLKASGRDNEMTRFRYDVLLRIGTAAPPAPEPVEHRDWADVADLAGLHRLLDAAPGTVVVDDIPNARVARFARLVGDVDAPEPAWSPADLDEVAARCGRRAHHAWSGRHPEQGRIRTTFTRRNPAADGPAAPFVGDRPAVDGPVSNDPRLGALLRVLRHSTRAALRRSLPEYMVPSRVLTLPALPLTPNGKTDRNALRAIARRQPASAEPTAPSGPGQDLLHEIWCDVLGVSRVGVTENVFDAGTTSLLIVRIRQELRDRHGIDIPLTAFFAHPTIAALAQHLRPEASPRPDAPRGRGADERVGGARTSNATAALRRGHRRRP